MSRCEGEVPWCRLLAPLADLYLRLQCAPARCSASLATAQLCCARNLNLECCYFTQSHL